MMSSASPSFRAFVAIELPDDVRELLQKIVPLLRRADRERIVRWVRPEGIHLTLKFLGDTSEDRVEEIEKALRNATAGHQPFLLRLGKVGAFSDSRSRTDRVIWMGLEGDGERLSALQQDVESALNAVGFTPEQRNFAPHLTLGRIPRGRRSSVNWNGMATLRLGNPSFQVTGISLMESALLRGGARYTRRFLAPLGTHD